MSSDEGNFVSVSPANIVIEDLDKEDPIELIKSYLNPDENNVLLKSLVPEKCKSDECIVGIDEAGRGPVLGPMVYGICYCSKEHEDILKTLGCADSKSLTEEKREDIFRRMNKELNYMGWAVDIISPSQISNCMLRRQKYSLNEVSHGSAIDLVKDLLKRNVNVTEIYVDTVGPPEKYEEKLQKIFRGIKVKVSKKADSLFPIVSAASICAKVTRDLALKNWTFMENLKKSEKGWGSGYPGDATTKAFLVENLDPVFGFPKIVRFSWSTASTILDEKGVPVDWSDDDEDDNTSGHQQITSFFKQSNDANIKKHSFFRDRFLQPTESL